MKYYVIFRSCEHRILKHILKKDFQHLGVIFSDGIQWLMLDPRADYLKFEALPYPADYDLPTKISEKQTIISYEFECKDSLRLRIIPALSTCVTITKYILGMRSFRQWFIWTPWQLYKYCKKLNKERA